MKQLAWMAVLIALTACSQAPTGLVGHPSGSNGTRIAGMIDMPDVNGMPAYYGGIDFTPEYVAFTGALGPNGAFALDLPADPPTNTVVGCENETRVTVITNVFTSPEPLGARGDQDRQAVWTASLRGVDARGTYYMAWIHTREAVTVPLNAQPGTCMGVPTRIGPGWVTLRQYGPGVLSLGPVAGEWVTTVTEF